MAKKSKTKKAKSRKRRIRPSARKVKKAKRRLFRPKRYDPRLEMGLKYMREGASLAEAARKIGVLPGRLRRYALATGTVTRKDGKWRFKRDRRFRQMPIYSNGRRELIIVHNGKTASLVGSYMRAVRLFLDTEDIALLKPFQDQSVPDIQGKRHAFETRPNVLYRLDGPGIETFKPYRIFNRE